MTASLPIYAYNIGWGVKQLGRASAVTVILLIFLLMLCALYFKLLDHWEKENG
jgi:multiple sugar transport system permease protein